MDGNAGKGEVLTFSPALSCEERLPRWLWLWLWLWQGRWRLGCQWLEFSPALSPEEKREKVAMQ